MVKMSEIEGLSELNTTTGKVVRPYLNTDQYTSFYIVNKTANRIAKVEIKVDDDSKFIFRVLNDHDDTAKYVSVNRTTVIDSEFGLIVCTLSINIFYFSKPLSISLYA